MDELSNPADMPGYYLDQTIIEGYNTPYSPIDESPDTIFEGQNTPYSPIAEAPTTSDPLLTTDMALDQAQLDAFLEGQNTPHSNRSRLNISTTPPDMAEYYHTSTAHFLDQAQLDAIFEGQNTPYSPLEHGMSGGNPFNVNDATSDMVPHGWPFAAIDTSTPEWPLPESPDNSGDWIPGPRTTPDPPIHMSAIFDMTALHQRDADIHGINTPYSPIDESPDSRINDIDIEPQFLNQAGLGATIEGYNTSYSPLKGGASSRIPLDFNNSTPYKNSSSSNNMATPYSPVIQSPDSRINDWISDVATHGQTDTAIDEPDLPYSPLTNATDVTFGRDSEIHDSGPRLMSSIFHTRDLNSPTLHSGSGTQKDPFIIDDETVDQMVNEAAHLREARGEHVTSRSDDTQAEHPRHLSELVQSQSLRSSVNFPQDFQDLGDLDSLASPRPMKMSSGKRAVNRATSNASEMAAANISQHRRSPFDLPQDFQFFGDFDFGYGSSGPSAVHNTTGKANSGRDSFYPHNTVAEDMRQPRQYLFVELPQEIEDMIFDFAFPGSDKEYVHIKSEEDWRHATSTSFTAWQGAALEPYPGHKINDFLGVSKQFFRAAAQAYLRNQGFNLLSVCLDKCKGTSASRLLGHERQLPLLQYCKKAILTPAAVLIAPDFYHCFPALNRVECTAATFQFAIDAPGHPAKVIMSKNDLMSLKFYQNMHVVRGLVEFRIVPESISRWEESDGMSNTVWETNMANLEALLKPLVTQPKPKTPKKDQNYGFTNEQFSLNEDLQDREIVDTPTSPVEVDIDQDLVDTIKSKSGPVDMEDQFHEGVMYGSDESIIKSFVKDPSGFIAWAREMNEMSDALNRAGN